MRYTPETYKRCIREGHDYWGSNGPGRNQCPYNRDDRAGAWSFGRSKARDGYSITRTWELFKTMEGI